MNFSFLKKIILVLGVAHFGGGAHLKADNLSENSNLKTPDEIMELMEISPLKLNQAQKQKALKKHSKNTGIPMAYTVCKGPDGSGWVFLYEQPLGNVEYIKDKLFYNNLGQALAVQKGLTYLGSDSGVYQRKETFNTLMDALDPAVKAQILKQLEFDTHYHLLGRKEMIFSNGKVVLRDGFDVGNGQGLIYIGSNRDQNGKKQKFPKPPQKMKFTAATSAGDAENQLTPDQAAAAQAENPSSNPESSAPDKAPTPPMDPKYLKTKPVRIIYAPLPPKPIAVQTHKAAAASPIANGQQPPAPVVPPQPVAPVVNAQTGPTPTAPIAPPAAIQPNLAQIVIIQLAQNPKLLVILGQLIKQVETLAAQSPVQPTPMNGQSVAQPMVPVQSVVQPVLPVPPATAPVLNIQSAPVPT